MNDVALFVAIFMGALSISIFCYWLGRAWLMAYGVFLGCFTITMGATSIEFMGMSLALASATYAASYLITDLLTERYGRPVARQAMMMTLGTYTLLPLFFMAALQLTPNEFSEANHAALTTLFEASWRMSLANFVTIGIAQSFDIYFYAWLMKKTKGKHLWLRNNASTMTSQFFDSILWWGISFAGIVDNWFALALSGWLIKCIVAALDTPIVYIARNITPLEILRTAKEEHLEKDSAA